MEISREAASRGAHHLRTQTKLGADQARLVSTQPDAERRQVTVMLIDMVDSTAIAERVGEEATYSLAKQVFALVTEIIERHDGTITDYAGDGAMALFGSPLAHEDAPLCACRAALDIQHAINDRGTDLENRFGVRPRFRVGIHAGPVVVGKLVDHHQLSFRALGHTVNVASRVEAFASGGKILITKEVQDLVEGLVVSSDVGEHRLKGKRDRQKLYRLDGIREGVTRLDASARRGLTPLVGRHEELGFLERSFEEARGGQIRVVHIVGDAGIGKTRLIREFLMRIDSDSATVLRASCSSDARGRPFGPFVEILRELLIEPETTEASLRQDLDTRLRALGLERGKQSPYLLNLFGFAFDPATSDLDPEMLGVRTRDAIRSVLLAKARQSPLIVLIDDVHWADTASEALLEWASRTLDESPLLIVCAYRPEYESRSSGNPNVIRVSLTPLSRAGTTDLVTRRLSAEGLSDELEEDIWAKTEGNPLFAEEVVGYLLDGGRLQQTEGRVSMIGSQESRGIPPSLENLLMQRVDRLDGEVRRVLQVACVVGQKFSAALLREICEHDGTLDAIMADLMRHELVFTERSDGIDVCRIKHALVRDTVYDSLLAEDRQALHSLVGDVIARRNPDQTSEIADSLAFHYDRSGRYEEAIRYMARAGQTQLRVYALKEARASFLRALELVDGNPGLVEDQVIADLVSGLGRIYYFYYDFKNTIRLIEHYLPRIEALGNRILLSRCLSELGTAYAYAARRELSKPTLERALAMAQEAGDDSAIGYACMGLMWHHVCWEKPGADRVQTVTDLSEMGFEAGIKSNDSWLAAKALLASGYMFLFHGRMRDMRMAADRLLKLADETDDHRPRAWSLGALAVVEGLQGNYQEAFRKFEESSALATDPITAKVVESFQGGFLAMAGRPREAFDMLQSVRGDLLSGDAYLTALTMDLQLGVARVLLGDITQGVRWIEASMQRFEDWGFALGKGQGHLILGEIYLTMVLGTQKPSIGVVLKNLWFLLRVAPFAASNARRHLQHAERFFRAHDAPFFHAWALLDLGLLASARRDHEGAKGLLREAHEIASAEEATFFCKRIEQSLAEIEPCEP